jgi:hypothetical protein
MIVQYPVLPWLARLGGNASELGQPVVIADTRSASSDMTNPSPKFYLLLLNMLVNYCHSPCAPCITGVSD